MIEITQAAQDYFRHLLRQQDAEGLNLRIQVLEPGTPNANCDLQFCPKDQRQAKDETVSFEAFDLYVADGSVEWLKEAEIDFEQDAAGGQLTIKAPNIKGSMPEEDAPLDERVEWILETEINPRLAAHGGRVALTGVTEKMEVVLQFGGGCHGCGMVDYTLKEGIETTLKGHFPEITGILDATDHDAGENPYYRQQSGQSPFQG